jgi:branched-chain amino acid aminotransferase
MNGRTTQERLRQSDTRTVLATPGQGHGQLLWRQGSLVAWEEATVHVRAVGHACVSAVFEGVRAYWNPDRSQLYVFRLGEHVRRLITSARLARLRLDWTAEELEGAVLDVLRANAWRQDVYVRPWTFVRGAVSELLTPAGLATETVIDSWPSPRPTGHQRGARVVTSSWRRIGDQQASPRVKAFANYHQSRVATAEAVSAGYDLPLFLNDRGQVAESSGACVAIVRAGAVITPPVSAGILESITRDTILTLAADLGLPVQVRDVDRAEPAVADEVFFMGTGWEVLPVVELDGVPVGDGACGTVTARLHAAYHRLVRGDHADHEDWLTPVWPGPAAPCTQAAVTPTNGAVPRDGHRENEAGR